MKKLNLVVLFTLLTLGISLSACRRNSPVAHNVPNTPQPIRQAVVQEPLGLKYNWYHVVVRDSSGNILDERLTHNLRTNAGTNWQYTQMAGSAAAPCTYLALSNATITPAVGDTTLSGEISANGLARHIATPTHTSNASSYSLAYTWTATGNQSVQDVGVFNDPTTGTMCWEDTFSPVSLSSTNTITLTATISF